MSPVALATVGTGTLAGSFNGLAFGLGTQVHIAELEGLEGLPGLRVYDEDRTGDHGSFRGTDLLSSRDLTITFHLIPEADSYETLRDAFKLAMTLSDELPLRLYNSTKRVNCRVRKRSIPVQCDRIQRYATAVVQFTATDPRIYAETQSIATVGLPESTGGLVVPAPVPWTLASSSSGGQINATNEGNFATRPVAVITGPADNPRLENLTAGKTVQFNLSLGTTDTLTVDFDARSVLLNGTASRRSTMTATSQWWELAPGTSTIRFNANAYTTAASLALSWRSAWL